jgi:adenine-specific DNA-methyltransferase
MNMVDVERQRAVLNLLRDLRSLEGLKSLFWEELNYERENKPISPRQWPDSVRQALAEDPILFASGGEDGAFHVLYCRLASTDLSRGLERPVVNQLLRDHPYALFVFSNKSQSAWHFLNVKYDEQADKRRLVRRITVRQGEGLRTAAERMALLDLQAIGPDLFGMSPLLIQQHHDEAFDVERVTKDFYREIANWYFWAREQAEFPADAPKDADGKPSHPLIRLLTRMIFCWFLKEKRNPQTGAGLLPDDLFDPRRIRELLKDASPEACSYYTAILQNLFFATLSTEMDRPGEQPNRRWIEEGDGQRSDDHMIHTVWRHARQLRDPDALENLLRGIPFLNGGLFECLDDRIQKGNSPYTVEVRIDGFATDPKKQPKLPNSLFYGAPQAVDLSDAYGDSSRRRETVRPLLEILNRYNFTLTENTPFDQEVALDPELLGHVFENLLAAFNPETGTVARKATGSFYTPRVVVDWMVDQALLVYLKGTLQGGADIPVCADKDRQDAQAGMPVPPASSPDARLKCLLSWDKEGHDFSPGEVERLIDAIDGLKAIDPACGSGAFPMGMLQKLVHVLKKLDPENQGWRRRQETAAETIESGIASEEALKAIRRAFARDNDDYGRKLYLIENCLYGVDIQPIAVQIAKLRFFISLVCDQAIDPSVENYGILPLPNLETKVVAANTLLGLHRGQLLLGSNEVKRLEGDLQRVRHDYFTARSYKRKKDLRKEDKRLCNELSKALEASGECTPHDAKRLVGWNPYDTNAHAAFFDPGWMFGLASRTQDGVFDVVIGNPPYVRQEELKNQSVIGSDGKPQPLKDALKGQYECFTGTADLYVYFFERSLQLLHPYGVLSFITSNKYFRAPYGELLRTYLAYATRPSVILDFGEAPIFEAVVEPAIIVTQKTRSVELGKLPKKVDAQDWESQVMTWTPGPDIRDFPDIFERDAFALAQADLKLDGWRIENPISLRLLDRLRKAGTPLGEYVKGRFYYGIKTGLNEAFVVDRATRDRLIAEHKSSADVLKPFLRGRDVKRWRCDPQDLWLIFTRRGIDIMKYPAIHEHLKPLKKRLTPGVPGGRKPGSYEWYEIQDNITYWQEFEQPKIVYQDIARYYGMAWDDSGAFLGNTCYFIPRATPYLLGVLLSSPIKYWVSKNFSYNDGGYLRMFSVHVEKFPIPAATPAQQALCEHLAEALIWLHSPAAKKAKDAPTGLMIAYLEQWLNGLVYELFFPGELHARRLKLFDETSKLNPPDLAKLSAGDKLTALQELHDKSYAKDAALRGMLFDLKSLDVVRVIEDEDAAHVAERQIADEAGARP